MPCGNGKWVVVPNKYQEHILYQKLFLSDRDKGIYGKKEDIVSSTALTTLVNIRGGIYYI